MLLQDMIIKQHILCLKPGDTLEKAVQIFRNCKNDLIPIVNQDEKLVGVFTRSNLYDALLRGAALHESIDLNISAEVYSLSADIPYDTVSDIVKKSPVGTMPVTDKEGKVIGLLTKTNMVLTLFKESEMLNKKLEAILDSIYNGVIVVNSKGEIELVNTGAERIFGIASESCRGHFIGQILPGLDINDALLMGETKVGLKFRYGKVTTIVNITPLTDNDGIIGAIATFQDLTDLEQVARELETVKALNITLDTVLNIIYDGIVVVDEKGYISLANSVFYNFLETSLEEIIGKHITEILSESRLHIVAKTGIPETCDIQTVKDKPSIVSRLPIRKEGRVVGAVGRIIFPQLAETQELASKLALLQNKIAYYRQELGRTKSTRAILDGIIAESPIMKKIKLEITNVAKSTSTILITGESGTGKELIAQAIHMCSDRKSGPFVKVNCAAIPENLLEAEFFGYVGGAYTGALKNGKLGRFELADGGTIFLDEVGDMPIMIQAKLLRVIQEREFERLGDTQVRKVNIRIIAATNKDLKKAITEGAFREDLYYRLNVIGIHLPSLREHPEDIPPLVDNFIDKYNGILNATVKGSSPEAMEVLLKHNWPGNIRELENVIERGVNYAHTGLFKCNHLPASFLENCSPVTTEINHVTNPYRYKLAETEKEMILVALKEAGGNKTKAAKILNLSRSRLYVKMQQYDINS